MNGPGVIAAGLSLVFITSCGGMTTLSPTGPSATLAADGLDRGVPGRTRAGGALGQLPD